MADATRSLKIIVEEEKKGDGYNQAAKDIDQYSGKVSEADLKTKKWAETQKTLQVEIDKSRTRIKELHEEVAKTGDTSIFGDIRKEEARIRGFESTLKALAPVAEQAGRSFADTLGESLKGVDFRGVLIPALIGAAVLIAPALGAIIAGAVTGVVGLGGVAGGLFAASKDPKVRAAASDLGHHISEVFFASGSSFVGPIQQAAVMLKHDFDSLDLKSTFALAAPYVTEFAMGIGGIATDFMPGFNQALAKGKPAIDLFASRLPEIGKDLGDMLSKMAGSKGTLEGVNSLFNLISGTIHITGTSIAWLGDRYHDFNQAAAGTNEFIAKVYSLIGDKQNAAAFQETADEFKNLDDVAQQGAIHFQTVAGAEKYNAAITAQMGDAAAEAAAKVKELDDVTRSLFGTENSLADANLAVAQGFLDLQTNLVKGKKNWSDNTQAGIDNQKMLQQQIEAIQRRRDAAVEAAGTDKAAIDAANKKYQEQLDLILDIGRKAGDTQAALDKLAGNYNINVVVNTIQHGVEVAAGIIASALSQVGIQKRASGGPVMAGQPYVVGDGGRPELFVPSQNGYIMPNVPTGGGGGGAPTVVISFAPTGNSLFDALLKELRKYIRIQGGDVQVALTG